MMEISVYAQALCCTALKGSFYGQFKIHETVTLHRTSAYENQLW